MTLPWFLNPWAEVRGLRAELKWRDHMRLDMAEAWREERRDGFRLAKENGELKRKLGEMHAYASCLEGKEILCGCQRCTDNRPGFAGPGKPGWRYACEKCGNKRCPHHEWHGFKCTGSNDPDQVGEEL